MMKIMFTLAVLSLGFFVFIGEQFWGMISGLSLFFIGIFFSKRRFKKK